MDEEIRFTESVDGIRKEERSTFNMFLSSIKKRVGYESRINVEDIVKAFDKKLIRVDRTTLLRFHYNVNKMRLVKCLVFDGEFFYVENNDHNIKAYKRSILDWYNEETNVGRKAMLGFISKVI